MATATTLKLVLHAYTVSFKNLTEGGYKASGLKIIETGPTGAIVLEGSRADVVAFAIEHHLFRELRNENHLNHLEITKVNCAEIMGLTYSAFTATTPAIGPNDMGDCNTMVRMVQDCLNKLDEAFSEYGQEADHW